MTETDLTPPTPDPETPTEATSAPETPAVVTPAPETPAVVTPAPETPAVVTSAPETPAVTTAPAAVGKRTPPDGRWWWGTGRRKAAVARVRIRPGSGTFVVNKRPIEQFFPGERDRKDLRNVLEKTKTSGAVDIHVSVLGGGFTGQAGAIVLGLARALRRYDETLEPILRDNNFLTRDPRKVERKKYGQRGARARFQFSKR